MGTWGAGVLENDNSREIYDDYLRLFDAGKSGTVIVRQLKRNYMDGGDARDRAEFWPAVALAQWECGGLLPETRSALARVIERGDGMDAWRAESPRMATARRRALAALLKKVGKDNPRPRGRGIKAGARPSFPLGACIAYRFPDGRWGAAIAVKARPGWSDFNFIKLLKYRKKQKPDLSTFELRDWLYPRISSGRRSDDPLVMPLPGSVVKKSPRQYQLIGTLKLGEQDDYDYYRMPFGDVGKIVAAVF